MDHSIPLMIEGLAPQPLPDPKNFEADPMGFLRKCHKTYIQDYARATVFQFDDKQVTIHHQSERPRHRRQPILRM